MNCPKCGGKMVSAGVDSYRFYWRCVDCNYYTNTPKPNRNLWIGKI